MNMELIFAVNFNNMVNEKSNDNTEKKQLPVMRHRIKEKSRLLPQHAIDVMTEWYERNYTNPYPTYREFEMLAASGSISIAQCKQWFVNVRRRTHNQFRKKRDLSFCDKHRIKRAKNVDNVENGENVDPNGAEEFFQPQTFAIYQNNYVPPPQFHESTPNYHSYYPNYYYNSAPYPTIQSPIAASHLYYNQAYAVSTPSDLSHSQRFPSYPIGSGSASTSPSNSSMSSSAYSYNSSSNSSLQLQSPTNMPYKFSPYL